jgi:outer membrane receptor protein involved in Fe transport
VVTAQTKSGTNSFHGSAYDFRTGNANIARDPFSQAPGSVPAGLKNRMGGSIGGPVLKNKAFFFFNYEGQRQKVGTSNVDTLPTNLMAESCLGKEPDSQGGNGCDFSQYLTQLGKAGTIYDQSNIVDGNPQPYPHNIIPRSEISGAASVPALALLADLAPYTTGIALGSTGQDNGLDSNYNGSGTGLFNSNQWTVRGDYTLSETKHVFGRFSRFTDVLSGGVMFGPAGGGGFGINNYGGNSTGANDSLAAGMDIAVSPKLLTDFRLGYYRYNIIDTKFDQGVEFANTLGIPGINTGSSFTSGSPGFIFDMLPGGVQNPATGTKGAQYGAGLGINRCNCPLTEREDQGQVVNNWTIVKGNHTLKVGTDLRYGRNLRVPSDTDRAGVLNFYTGATSWPGIPNDSAGNAQSPGGLGFATFMLGEVSNFGRFVSTSTNAKEFQKRAFFYGQDTWRVSHNLTLNLGLRWELYFPETVNATGNGSLLNINDGYLHVAGVGGIPSDLGWGISKAKMFDPRIGLTYQLDPKTVIRAGYGRSFDTGVFGSIFGHTVTQNLPVLGSQSISPATTTGYAFTLNAGPPTPATVTVPSNGLLPNPGSQVSSSSRPNPLQFPTIDAWNLSVQRALTPTLTLTIAYVGNKGTHTLGDGDGNNTNPNEPAINLPAQYSVNGQALHYDPSVAANAIAKDGGTSTYNFLRRYYGGSLAACKDSNYTTPSEPFVTAGMCGWTNGITYKGDNQNTEFDAMQITLAQQFSKGLAITGNYQWASAFAEQTNFYTWNHQVTHGRDSNTRDQQMTMYGSYDFPFGKGKQFAPNVNHVTDLLIGGYQLSGTMNWAGGLPFTASYSDACSNVPSCNGGTAPNFANVAAGDPHMPTHLTGFVAGNTGTGSRSFYNAQTIGGGIFTSPGLDNIGNVGFNTYRGPTFFSTDLAITKAFTIWESVAAKFRMDAFNAFNHINPGNPGGTVDQPGTISGEANGCFPNGGCGPRQLEFSLRVQF